MSQQPPLLLLFWCLYCLWYGVHFPLEEHASVQGIVVIIQFIIILHVNSTHLFVCNDTIRGRIKADLMFDYDEDIAIPLTTEQWLTNIMPFHLKYVSWAFMLV